MNGLEFGINIITCLQSSGVLDMFQSLLVIHVVIRGIIAIRMKKEHHNTTKTVFILMLLVLYL